MLLPLTMKIGEVGHRQYRRTAARWSAEQRRLQAVIVPLWSKRPPDLGSFSPLQILVCSAEANRATSGDRSQPQAHFKLQSKNFFDLAHGQSPGWQADPPFVGGGCLPLCCPALLRACGNHSGEAEHHSGIGLKLFGFIAESVFTFIPESCSTSSRNTVRNHPGIAFTLPRIPHPGIFTPPCEHFMEEVVLERVRGNPRGGESKSWRNPDRERLRADCDMYLGAAIEKGMTM